MERAIANAQLMRLFHTRFGVVPNYEDLLEKSYRLLVAPGDTVVDIGAHTGRHTAVFAELVGREGRVHAFEPLPFAFDVLSRRELPRNVLLHNCAISETEGVLPFYLAQGAPEESGLRIKVYNNPASTNPQRIEVKAMRLDSFMDQIPKSNFIKIDAEGAEIGCLNSGRDFISRSRPFISVEYGYPGYSAFGLTAASLYEVAESMDYVVCDMFGAACPSLAVWERVCDAAYWDWFLVPRERMDEWSQKIDLR
jgi:FkbM family methyltransferase